MNKKAIKKRHNNKCKCCGTGSKLTVHHVKPLSRKGSNNPENLIILCEFCHLCVHKFPSRFPEFIDLSSNSTKKSKSTRRKLHKQAESLLEELFSQHPNTEYTASCLLQYLLKKNVDINPNLSLQKLLEKNQITKRKKKGKNYWKSQV